MSQKKVQLYLDEHKDRQLFDLVERLEKEGKKTRGYVTERIKERLKAFEILSETFGETDPMQLAIKLAAGVQSPEKSGNKSESKFKDEILAIGKGAQEAFDVGEEF